MHLRAKRPVLVPTQYWPEIEKLSKATLMDIAWDLAQRCSGDDGLNAPKIMQELRDTTGIVNHYRRFRTVSYQITGLSAELVQREIDRLFNQVEQIGGCAEFDTPKRKGNGYYSEGYTFLQPYMKQV